MSKSYVLSFVENDLLLHKMTCLRLSILAFLLNHSVPQITDSIIPIKEMIAYLNHMKKLIVSKYKKAQLL